MKKYILGNKIISTTPERYETTFKDMGYVPYKEKVENKESTKKQTTKKQTTKKDSNNTTDNKSNEIKKD